VIQKKRFSEGKISLKTKKIDRLGNAKKEREEAVKKRKAWRSASSLATKKRLAIWGAICRGEVRVVCLAGARRGGRTKT